MIKNMVKRKYPEILVTFLVKGKKLDLNEFSKKMDIIPTETRSLEDWPEAIKKNKTLPVELQPRCVWKITMHGEKSNTAENLLNEILRRLEDKVEVLISECEKYNLTIALILTVYCEANFLPEMTFSKEMVEFMGKLKGEIIIDLNID
jgi:hypothetical protein